MTRKEKKEDKEWKEIWGNAGLSQSKLIDKILLDISAELAPISQVELFTKVFGTAGGVPLDHAFKQAITILTGENLINVSYKEGIFSHDPYFSISATGINLINRTIKTFALKLIPIIN